MKKIFSVCAAMIAAMTLSAQTPIVKSCAEAAAIALALTENNVPTEEVYSITGYVTNVVSAVSKGQQTFWMDDEKGDKKTFESYYCNLPKDDQNTLNVGDKVKIVGKIMKYNTTPEMKNGDITILNRVLVQRDTFTVTTCEAYDKCSSLSDGDASIDYFIVRDKVMSVDDTNENYGWQNITFQCEEGKLLVGYHINFGGKENFCAVGDSVEIIGTLKNYGGKMEIEGKGVVFAKGQVVIDNLNNIITYTATSKLTETTDTYSAGLLTNAFNTAISSHTFSNGTGTITFSGKITTIGDYAFRGCSGLTSVTIPNSVTTIGNYAFFGCTSLTKTNYTGTIVDWCKTKFSDYTANPIYYSKNLFINNAEIKDLVIPTGVETIEDYAFDGCSGLTSVTIPSSVTTIGNHAFDGCSGLTSVTIPNSVTTIGNSAFYGCSGLTSVTISNSITTIGEWVFKYCTGLTSVTIPNSVTTIGEEAFSYCVSLTSVAIGNSVTTIGEDAFYKCSGLTSITLPFSITTIEGYAFSGCTGLTKTNYTGTISDWCKIRFNGPTPTSNPMYHSHNFYINDVEVKDLVIPSDVDAISNYAFYNCDILTSVTIGNSVTTIGDKAFYNCYGLKTVYNLSNLNITKGSTDNGYVAYYANNVYDGILVGDFVIKDDTIVTEYIGTATEIIIPNGITVIEEYAFYNCSGLTSITIPNSVTTIGERAFMYCSGLTSVVIPSSVTTIRDYAFSGCGGLSSVTIPNSVTTIGSNAFYNCSSLTSVTIGNSITTIGDYAFSGCGGLTSIIIPSSVTTIGRSAFYYCWGLTSVTIGNSVTMIEDNAFYDCDNLSSVTIEATTPPSIGSWVWSHNGSYCVFYIPCGTKTAYQEAWGHGTFIEPSFDYALELKESEYGRVQNTAPLTCANNVAVLVAYPQAGYHFAQWNDGNTDNPRSVVITQDTTMEAFFAMDYSGQCGDNLYWQYNNDTLSITGNGAMYDGQPWYLFVDSITEISLPSELTTIGASAFANIAKLNSITIPALVTAIGDYAFDGCRKLFDIYCLAIEPPVAQTSSFTNYNVYLHVPCNILRDYQMDAVFGSFKYIECMGAEETFIEGDQVIVITSTDNVTLTWPADDQAAGYSIEITKDGVVFCTLKFNANGQLTSIAFAPSRWEAHTMPAATMTTNGWQFTVTELTPGSKYNYTIDVLDASQQSIKQYKGEFTTTGGISTDLEGLTIDNAQCTVKKMIIDNQLFIRRGNELYNAMGQKVK
ncbi:MAG: leucine-rich repeat protein [Bacteroidales bacterium]|nr:leucine-rich repeat protein [Candidatus Colicola coprequi]